MFDAMNRGYSKFLKIFKKDEEDLTNELRSTNQGKRIRRNALVDVSIGPSALHVAVAENNVTLIDYLIRNGADINVKDADGRTPLHWATEDDHLLAVRHLVEQGANLESKDRKGRTSLHVAAMKDHTYAIEFFADNGVSIDPRDEDGRTPLHLAAYENYLGAVVCLFEHGANIHAKDKKNRTVLHLATMKTIDSCAINYLLHVGADVDLYEKDIYGDTPVDTASVPNVYRYIRLVRVAILNDEERSHPRNTRSAIEPQFLQPTIPPETWEIIDAEPTRKPVQNINPYENISNIFVFASLFARSKQRQQVKNQNLSSPTEILENRMDKIALDSIYNFSPN